MTKEEILMSCEKEIQTRLRKYDVVNLSWNQEWQEAVRKNIEEYAETNGEQPEETDMFDLFEKAFSKRTRQLDFVEAMSGSFTIPELHADYIPIALSEVYLKTVENLKKFREGCWWLYQKDVLRALAYHQWVSEFELKSNDIYVATPFEDSTSYKNVPINIKIEAGINEVIEKNGPYYVDSKIGGGIISKDFLGSKINHNFKYIYRKADQAFDLTGKFISEKEKGISYKVWREGIEYITKQSMSAADVWFFKNAWDPELTYALYREFEKIEKERKGKRESYINPFEYKVIWILCKCKCPSIRLYIFEAIKYCYFYKPRFMDLKDTDKDFLLKELDFFITDVNLIFQYIVNATAAYSEENLLRKEKINKRCEDLNQIFQGGDDFLFIFRETYSVGIPNTSEHGSGSISKYFNYMPETLNSKGDRFAFLIISALNEQWNSMNKEREQECEIGKFQEEFQSRLFSHLNPDMSGSHIF